MLRVQVSLLSLQIPAALSGDSTLNECPAKGDFRTAKHSTRTCIGGTERGTSGWPQVDAGKQRGEARFL